MFVTCELLFAIHSEGLATASLTIGKDCRMETSDDLFDQEFNPGSPVHRGLIRVSVKHLVEEILPFIAVPVAFHPIVVSLVETYFTF